MTDFSSQIASSDYLSLLTVQLQNQDPIDPVDQESFINDVTQFSILEGIQNLNTSFEQVRQLQEISQGLSLVGKQIQYIDPATGELGTGKVDEIFTSQNEIRVAVNGQSIGVGSIVSIAAESSS